MRSLRDRLRAVTTSPPMRTAPPTPKQTPFFCREHLVPLGELYGIEQTTLAQVRACDPNFTGTSWDVSKLLFLDTETTGLSGGVGTIAFEIGLGWIEPRGMVIRQYVMRDYSEEAAMLSEIADVFRRFDTIISFNGKSFDLPLLESRMTMNRIHLAVTTCPHFDLLHAARRVYKLRLGRCSLATLEAAVFGEAREDDLPGALVPQRYFDFIKTHEFALLEDVLRHNKQDVQSLAQLTGHLCAVFTQPESLAHAEDIFSVGKTLLRTGHTERGRRCLRILGHSSLSSKAHMHLAISYKKERNWQEAVSSWQEMIARGEGGTWPYIELAKYYEHAQKDPSRALTYAQHALVFSLNTSLLREENPQETDAIMKRITRLKAKLSRTEESSGGI